MVNSRRVQFSRELLPLFFAVLVFGLELFSSYDNGYDNICCCWCGNESVVGFMDIEIRLGYSIQVDEHSRAKVDPARLIAC